MTVAIGVATPSQVGATGRVLALGGAAVRKCKVAAAPAVASISDGGSAV